MHDDPFREAYFDYISYIHGNMRTISQKKADRLFGIADDLVPNARLTELSEYSEVERTDEEVVQEAVRRQQIYEKEGGISLLLQIREQQVAALANSDIILRHKNNAEGNIEAIDTELKKLREMLN